MSTAIIKTLSERITLILAFASIILSIALYATTPSQTIPLWIAAAIAIFLLSFIWVLIATIGRLMGDMEIKLPGVLATIVEGESDEGLILLLEPSELFGLFAQVSIYNKDPQTDYEVLVAYGEVQNIQGDQKIQIRVHQWAPTSDEYANGLRNQAKDAMTNTIVRPSAPRQTEDRRSGLTFAEIDQIITAAQSIQWTPSLEGSEDEQ